MGRTRAFAPIQKVEETYQYSRVGAAIPGRIHRDALLHIDQIPDDNTISSNIPSASSVNRYACSCRDQSENSLAVGRFLHYLREKTHLMAHCEDGLAKGSPVSGITEYERLVRQIAKS